MVLIAPAGMVNMRDIYMGEYQQAQQDGYFTTTSNGREYRISTSWYEDLFSLELLFQTYAERENSLIIYGTQDAMIPVETALACAEQIGAQTLEVAGGYHSMGLSGTLPAVFEKVRAGVVDFFVKRWRAIPLPRARARPRSRAACSRARARVPSPSIDGYTLPSKFAGDF